MSQQPITAILNFDDVYFKFLRQLISKLYRFFFRQSSKTKNKFGTNLDLLEMMVFKATLFNIETLLDVVFKVFILF